MNGVDREELMELVALHALGVLPPTEHALVGAFLLEDADARAEWERLRSASGAVGMIAEEPVDSARSARMKERLLAAVHADLNRDVASLAPQRIVTRWWLFGAALAAAAAFVFALTTVVQDVSLRGELAVTQRQVAAYQQEIGRDHVRLTNANRALADIAAADARRFSTPNGEVVVRGDHLYLTMHDLPALPRGHVYQAWTLPNGAKEMAPSLTFVPDPRGAAVIALPDRAGGIGAVAVSVEPEGGSRHPTTKPTFVRPLS